MLSLSVLYRLEPAYTGCSPPCRPAGIACVAAGSPGKQCRLDLAAALQAHLRLHLLQGQLAAPAHATCRLPIGDAPLDAPPLRVAQVRRVGIASEHDGPAHLAPPLRTGYGLGQLAAVAAHMHLRCWLGRATCTGKASRRHAARMPHTCRGADHTGTAAAACADRRAHRRGRLVGGAAAAGVAPLGGQLVLILLLLLAAGAALQVVQLGREVGRLVAAGFPARCGRPGPAGPPLGLHAAARRAASPFVRGAASWGCLAGGIRCAVIALVCRYADGQLQLGDWSHPCAIRLAQRCQRQALCPRKL